jgi:hypothetical protein
VARNDQVIRQWHLLRRLEGSTALTLEELAAGLPDDLPKNLRTLRRDLAALETVGFPLTTDQVNGQTRWKLLDGFRRLPALGFAPSELMALIFSRDLLKPLQGTYIHGALDSALTKASAALPPSGLDFVRQMREFLSVRFGPHKTYSTFATIGGIRSQPFRTTSSLPPSHRDLRLGSDYGGTLEPLLTRQLRGPRCTRAHPAVHLAQGSPHLTSSSKIPDHTKRLSNTLLFADKRATKPQPLEPGRESQ